jgi:hypothetical protein
MTHVITIQYQCAVDGQRPTDEALNPEPIVTTNMGDIPNVGDYVSFNDEIIYRVKTRFFDYKKSDKDNWTIFANVLVEKESEEKYNYLVKH